MRERSKSSDGLSGVTESQVNLKDSHYRPMGPEGSGRLRLPDSVTSALGGGWLSALRSRRLYPQYYPVTHFKRLNRPRAHGIVGCHGNKFLVTPPGIDPGIFQPVS
jgi:hypothetical protein